MSKPKTVDGATFRLQFQALVNSIKDDDEVYFGAGDLSLYRIKERGPVAGPRLVQIDFNELYSVTHDPSADN